MFKRLFGIKKVKPDKDGVVWVSPYKEIFKEEISSYNPKGNVKKDKGWYSFR